MAKKDSKDFPALKAIITDRAVCRFILDTQSEMRLDGAVNKKNLGLAVTKIIKDYIILIK